MKRNQKPATQRFDEGDITEAEFYRIKGVIEIFRKAPKEDLLTLIELEGHAQDELLAGLAVEHLMNVDNVQN